MDEKKSTFDKFVEDLQQEIINQELNEFNEYIVELFHNPKNWGKPKEFTISSSLTGSCNDTLNFFLTIEDDIITKANFVTDGCGATVAAASQTTIFIEGNDIEFASNLTPRDIDEALHGLPEDHKHCAILAIKTLKKTLLDYTNNNKKGK